MSPDFQPKTNIMITKKIAFSHLVKYVVGGLILVTALILSLEIFIYPGVVAAKMLLSTLIPIVIALLVAGLFRLFRLYRLPDKVVLALVILASATNLTYFVMLFGNRVLYPTFSLHLFHIHPHGLVGLASFLFILSCMSLTKDFLRRHSRLLLFLLPFWMFFFVFLLSRVSYRTFWYLEREDSLTEWLTFFCYILCTIFSLQIARLSSKSKELSKGARVFVGSAFLMAAVIFIAIAGEEISWGQRLFGFETPESIKASNTQYEFNLHNQKSIFRYVYMGYGAVAVYSAVTWLLVRLIKKIIPKSWQPMTRFFAPPWMLIGFFLPMIPYVYVRKVYGDYWLDHWGEFVELLLAMGIAIFLLRNKNFLKSAAKAEK